MTARMDGGGRSHIHMSEVDPSGAAATRGINSLACHLIKLSIIWDTPRTGSGVVPDVTHCLSSVSSSVLEGSGAAKRFGNVHKQVRIAVQNAGC